MSVRPKSPRPPMASAPPVARPSVAPGKPPLPSKSIPPARAPAGTTRSVGLAPATRAARSEPPKRAAKRARDEAEEAREDAFVAAFGEHVRIARLARKLTQAALAERARLSSNYVARLERGEVGASLWVAHCLAGAMSMKVGELLDRDRLLPPPPLRR